MGKMEKTRFNIQLPDPATLDRAKTKKERYIIVAILLTVTLLTVVEIRITGINDDFPISSTVLMFILINTNLLLLLALILLVFRNLAKLYYEKKARIFGTKFKTKLVVAFITLALLPTSVLFFFSIHFMSTSLAFWFNAPVEQALENSLSVGRQLYEHIESKNLFFAKRAAFQIDSGNLLIPENEKALSRYIQVIQRAFHLQAVEIYSPDARRTALSLSPELNQHYFGILTSDVLRNRLDGKNTRTIFEEIDMGETIRTITQIPFSSDTNTSSGFLVITSLISPELSRNLASISRGTEEYQQLKMIKRPAQISNYIALSIVALLAVFCAVWFGFYLAKSITIPIMKFAEGTQRVTRGDLSYKIDFKADDEIGMLIDSFNSMTAELAAGREKIALSRQMMRKQNAEIEERRQYMEIVLKNISAGVISINSKGLITTINKSAESMLSIDADNILGHDYKKILKGEHLKLAEKISREIPHSLSNVAFPINITINGSPKHFAAHFSALQNDAGEHMGAVMVFDDMTELEKAQRMAAWREVARRIAHEVKNPLTPIKLSAQRLKRKYSHKINESVFDNCTNMIVDNVDIIKNLVNDFSTFAKFPDTMLRPCRIEQVVHETISLYREGLDDVDIRFTHTENLPEIQLDHRQMKQAFINLLDNAVAAVNQKGIILIDITHDEILKFVRIEVADNGKGITDQEKTRLFEPYFSTKKSGMGLGLAIVNSIITDHNGMIRVQDNLPAGAKFIIELPA